MDNFEDKLFELTLPEETDITHQYRLRRALLNSKYFEESKYKIVMDRLKFYLTSRRVVATVTIGLVVAIGGTMNYSLRGNTLELDNVVSEDDVVEKASSTTPITLENPITTQPAVVQAASAVPSEDEESTQEPTLINILSLDEITRLLQQTYSSQNGSVMVKTADGIFMYTFDNTSQKTNSSGNNFEISNFNPDITLTSSGQ